MSSGLVTAWPYGIIGVSDRRLVSFDGEKIKTNRSTKLTIFGCADAHGVIIYSGIGIDDAKQTPSDWLLELQAKERLFDRSLSEVLRVIKTDLEKRLVPLRAKYGCQNARHSFVLGVWEGSDSVIMPFRITKERILRERKRLEHRSYL